MACGTCGGSKVAYQVTYHDPALAPVQYPTAQQALQAIRKAGGKASMKPVKKT